MLPQEEKIQPPHHRGDTCAGGVPMHHSKRIIWNDDVSGRHWSFMHWAHQSKPSGDQMRLSSIGMIHRDATGTRMSPP